MRGIKYRLDSHYILGLLQSKHEVLSEAIARKIIVALAHFAK